MIGIVDYNAGNIKSVERALSFLNYEYVISKNPSDLKNAEKLIFPGVGEAKYAMEQLKKTGFDVFLKDFADSGKLLLGICLGSQIIFDYSEEGDVECLGLIKGKIKHFESVMDKNLVNENGLKYKIPHMGWNNLDFLKPEDKIFAGIDKNASYYFVHSYLIQPEDSNVILATADYGVKVPSAIKSNNIYAFQFHPEKSGEWGLKLLQNFINL
jgi:glutamine amidotransferase